MSTITKIHFSERLFVTNHTFPNDFLLVDSFFRTTYAANEKKNTSISIHFPKPPVIPNRKHRLFPIQALGKRKRNKK